MKTVTVWAMVLILLGVTGVAQAVPCVGVAPQLPGLAGVTCDMIDQEQQLTVTLQGNAVTTSTTEVVPSVFTFFGTNWKVRLTVELTDDPVGGDTVFLLGRVFHQAQPHPADDLGPGGQIVFSGLGATATDPFGWTVTGLPIPAAHGKHSDRYTLEPLGMVGVVGAPNQIANWSFEFKGIHVRRPVPEPGSLWLLGSGFVALAAVAGQRRWSGKRDGRSPRR